MLRRVERVVAVLLGVVSASTAQYECECELQT
jgi:hypothetical protein